MKGYFISRVLFTERRYNVPNNKDKIFDNQEQRKNIKDQYMTML